MLWLFNSFYLFLSPWIRIPIQIQKTPESGSETLQGIVLNGEKCVLGVPFHGVSSVADPDDFWRDPDPT